MQISVFACCFCVFQSMTMSIEWTLSCLNISEKLIALSYLTQTQRNIRRQDFVVWGTTCLAFIHYNFGERTEILNIHLNVASYQTDKQRRKLSIYIGGWLIRPLIYPFFSQTVWEIGFKVCREHIYIYSSMTKFHFDSIGRIILTFWHPVQRFHLNVTSPFDPI